MSLHMGSGWLEQEVQNSSPLLRLVSTPFQIWPEMVNMLPRLPVIPPARATPSIPASEAVTMAMAGRKLCSEW